MAKYLGNRPTAVPIQTSDLEDSIVTSAKILDGTIAAADLGANSVDSSELVDGSIDLSHLSASGTKSSSTYFRGDNSFATISAGTALTGSTNNTITTVTGANAISGEANLTFDGTDLTVGTGDIVFGTSGKGICLGVTSNTDANTLDDYEEGTWTPTWGSESGDLTSTSGAYGKYTKIGNMIQLWFGVTFDSGTASNYYKMFNSPFTAATNSSGTGVESTTGKLQNVWWDSGGTQVNINNYDNTFVTDAVIKCSIIMQV